MTESRNNSAITHRYDAALHFERVTAPCAACEREWPCDLAGHKGFFGYSAIHDEESWRCAIDCPHPEHNGSQDGES